MLIKRSIALYSALVAMLVIMPGQVTVIGQDKPIESDSTVTAKMEKSVELRSLEKDSDLKKRIVVDNVEPEPTSTDLKLPRSFLDEAKQLVDKKTIAEAIKKDVKQEPER